MAKSYAVIGGRRYDLAPLEVVRIMASHAGFTDVDCEPTGIGTGYRITASYGDERSPVKVPGKTLEAACTAFCESLT